jgi:hypothetical protein
VNLLWERARLTLRGLDYRWRNASEIPAEELLRVDSCDTAARQLTFLDVGESFLFQMRMSRLALNAGEPERVATALAYVASMRAAEGGSRHRRAETLMKQSLRLAERHPHALALVTLLDSIMKWSAGSWKDSLVLVDRSQRIAEERQVPFAAEQYFVHHFAFDCLTMLGEWPEIGRRLPPILAGARQRGDRLLTSMMLVHSFVSHLASGRPDEAEKAIRDAVEVWPQAGFFATSYWGLYGRVEARLYRGEGQHAWELIKREWSSVRRSAFVEYIETLRLLMYHLRARTALAAAETAPGSRGFFDLRERMLRAAARAAGKVERQHMPWSDPLARLIRAGIAELRGRREQALALLADAEECLVAADMRMYSAAARRQRGQLLGGAEGQALVEAADASMKEQDVREPDRIAAMLVPGFKSATKDSHSLSGPNST